MKKTLFFMVLLCGAIASAQTITWTGATDMNWGTASNWSSTAIPTASNDVIIPTGKTVVVNVAGITKSITVQGNATVTIAGGLSFTNTSSFAANTVTNWSGGVINGGGTLSNAGTLSLTTGAAKAISQATTISNTGTINILDGGLLYLNDGIVNNLAGGTLNLSSDGGLITWSGAGSHLLNNVGNIIRNSSVGSAQIVATLHNTGTISATTGTLVLDNPDNLLTGGTYNVSLGAILNCQNVITCAGTLTGAVNGTMNLSGNLNFPAAVIFNFTGTPGINWTSGTFSGPGSLGVNSKLNLTSGAAKVMNTGLTLNNNNTINILDSGLLYLNNGIVNNLVGSTLNLSSDGGLITWSGTGSHLLNNAGNIIRNTSVGSAQIVATLHNTGIISATTGTLVLDNPDNLLTGGTYNVSSGAILTCQNIITCAGTLAGAVNGTMNLSGNLNFPAAVIFNFTGTPGINWTNGTFSGPGSLGVNSKLNLTSGAAKAMNNGLTLNNNNTINILDSGLLYVNDGILNNPLAGTINLSSDGSLITWSGNGSHLLNNAGTIIRNISVGSTQIQASLKNTGTISVNSGTLILNDPDTVLTGGVYNVAATATFKWQNIITCAGTLTGVVNGAFNLTETVIIPVSAVFNFTGTLGINWSSGTFSGPGILGVSSLLNLTTGATKLMNAGITLNNNSTINILESGLLYLNNGILNNLAGSTINLSSDGSLITWSGTGNHLLNNAGTIIRNTTTGSTQIQASLKNTGTILVNSGSLILNDPDIVLTGGKYNVSSGTFLRCISTVTFAGILNGTLNGTLYFSGNENIPVAATLNFTGTDSIKWENGTITGGGTLTNNSLLNLTTGATKLVNGLTTINNSGTINIQDGGVLYVNDGIVNNLAAGTIDMRSDSGNITWSGTGSHLFNNFGLLKKSTTNGIASMQLTTVNSGIIEAQSGNLAFDGGLTLTNNPSGIVKGTATITPPPAVNFTNNGIFSPGGTPGILTFAGDFKSTATSVLAVDLNGLTSGTGYDVLNIQGNAIFKGTVNITLGFAPAIGNQFIVATTTGTISDFTLAPIAVATFNNSQYTFNVTKVTNNKVVLTLDSILAADNFVMSNAMKLYPNPAIGTIHLKNDSGIIISAISIADLNGRTVMSVKPENNIFQEIDLSNLSAGTYLVKITSGAESTVKKIMVE